MDITAAHTVPNILAHEVKERGVLSFLPPIAASYMLCKLSVDKLRGEKRHGQEKDKDL